MKETSFKYLPHAYDPESTLLANKLPMWHPIRTKRMSSTGHKLLNSTIGAGLSDIRYKSEETIDNLFLNTCRTDQLGPIYVKSISDKGRDATRSRNLLYNSAFEWAPRIDGIAWQWTTAGEKISDSTSYANSFVTRNITDYFYGGNSLTMAPDEGYRSYLIQGDEMHIRANDTIGISIMYKGDNTLSGTDGLYIYLSGRKVSDGTYIPTTVAKAEADTDGIYMRLSASVNFAHDVDYVNFVVKVRNNESDDISYNVDSAQMEIGGVTAWHIRYDDPVWFIDSENNGPYDVFYSDTVKHRIIYCENNDDFLLRSAPTRAILSTLNRNIEFITNNIYYGYKVEFDKNNWVCSFKIENNKVVKYNASISAEEFSTYDLYELDDTNTMSINSNATLYDLVVIDELMYIIAYENDTWVIKICNPESNEPEDSYLYVINTIEIEDDYGILTDSVSDVAIVQALGRNNIFGLDVTYTDNNDTETLRLGITLKFDYYIYDLTNHQIITREDYTSNGGVIVGWH